jgi:hypothetical protein
VALVKGKGKQPAPRQHIRNPDGTFQVTPWSRQPAYLEWTLRRWRAVGDAQPEWVSAALRMAAPPTPMVSASVPTEPPVASATLKLEPNLKFAQDVLKWSKDVKGPIDVSTPSPAKRRRAPEDGIPPTQELPP